MSGADHDGGGSSLDGFISDNSLPFDLMADDIMDLAEDEPLGGIIFTNGDGAIPPTGTCETAEAEAPEATCTANGSASASAAAEKTSEAPSGTRSSQQTKSTAGNPGNPSKSNPSKSRKSAKKKAPKAAASSSAPTESFEYITTNQINQHDVLCGRGAGIVNNPGNAHFRTLVVARKDEYNSTERNREKNAIARSICRHVRTEVVPPGRFLKRATKAQAAKWGFVGEKAAADVWVPVDEKTMLDRAMQSLREKDVKYIDNIKQGKHHLKRKSGGSGRRSKESDGGTHTASAGSSANSATSTVHMGSDNAKAAGTTSITGGTASGSIAIPKQMQQLPQQQQPFENGNIWPQHQQQPHSSQALGQPASAAALYNADPSTGSVPLNQATNGALTNANANSTFGWYESSTLHVPHSSASPDTFSLDRTRGGLIGLKDWISAEMIHAMSLHGSQVQEADRYYQLQAAKLALTLLQTVQMYHENGIAFGRCGIGSDKIRVSKNIGATANEAGSSSAVYSVTITSTAPQSTSEFDDDVKFDLVNVGAVLYELFSGIPPFQNQEDMDLFDALASAVDVDLDTEDDNFDVLSKKKRGRVSTAASNGSDCIPLRDLGLPVTIDDLVNSLMNLKEDSVLDCSKQTADFVGDIQLMINEPDRCLFDIEDATAEAIYQWAQGGYRLEFPQGKLYGRDGETARLMSVFDHVIRKGGRVEAVTVSGYSGIGKTSLISQLRQPTIERGGFFISGKFDKLRQAKPLSAIAQALDAFCHDLISRRQDQSETFDSICASMRSVIGTGGGGDFIIELIPNLGKIIPRESQEGTNRRQLRRASTGTVQGVGEVDKNALNRFMFFFRKFFHAIASPSHPVVLFIDDLQWADTMSLDLIRSIVCESDAHSFLFVGSYRSNEVNRDHPLLSHLGQIRTAGVPLLGIELSNMTRDSVNALISDTLKLSPLLTRPLADAVYSKTSGNCLFVVELLSDLHRQGLLRYSVSSRRWEWDDEAIAALDIQANVVDLMRRKLLRLGATEMWSVKVAACLGAETKKSTLDLLSFGLGLTPENGLVALLRRPVEEGLLMKVGSSYRFSHDQIQQAAYSLVTVGDRPSFHLQLGRSLCNAASPMEEADADVLFTCVDQLNRGSSKISDRITKVLVAQLNLQAGKKSIASSAFLTASIYLRFALCYLDESDWENNYGMCLEIYSSLSETEYVTGKYEEMTLVLNEVFARARTFDDKLRAYYTLATATAAQNDVKAAMSICFEVLRQLGEPFEEKEVDRATVMREFVHTKSMLENKDMGWFMSQNLMTDWHALNSMKFMNILILYLYLNDAQKLPLMISRMVQLTVSHGMCKVSATAFSSHGLVCCGFLGDYAEGYRVGKIAAAITERLGAQELVARVNVLLYGCINVWTEPLQSTLPPLMAGHDAGVSSGDPEYALLAFQIYNLSAFQCGQPLNEIVKKMAELDKERKQYRFHITTVTFFWWQCILNLIGGLGQEDPTVLEGEIIQVDSILHMQIERKMKGSACQYYLARLLLAYTFGKYELAAEMHGKCMEAELDKNLKSRFTVAVFALYGGLTSLAMARIDPENSKWNEIANSSISKMETWASSSAWNFEHKLCFLRAEKVANDGDRQGATALYERAVKLAREHGFVNEEAVICERYAEFLRLTGDEDSAKYQYDKAYDAYMKWGALRKCEDLKATT